MPQPFPTQDFQGHRVQLAVPSWKEQVSEDGTLGDFTDQAWKSGELGGGEESQKHGSLNDLFI